MPPFACEGIVGAYCVSSSRGGAGSRRGHNIATRDRIHLIGQEASNHVVIMLSILLQFCSLFHLCSVKMEGKDEGRLPAASLYF